MEARARVETLSEWIESVNREQVRQEVEGTTEEDYLEAVFSHLTVRELRSACELLQRNGVLTKIL